MGTSYGATYNNDISINYPASVHDYHPYNGVYGGALDVLTGVLTVDRAMVDLGTLTWGKASAETKYPRFYSNSLKDIIKPTDTNSTITDAICSDYRATTFDTVYRGNTNGVFAVVNAQSGAKGSFSVVDSRFDNADDFKAAMDGIQFCYPLLKPVIYQLTPHEVKSLLGQNNIWADTGDTTVEYRADIQKWVEKKLSAQTTVSLTRFMPVQTEETEPTVSE